MKLSLPQLPHHLADCLAHSPLVLGWLPPQIPDIRLFAHLAQALSSLPSSSSPSSSEYCRFLLIDGVLFRNLTLSFQIAITITRHSLACAEVFNGLLLTYTHQLPSSYIHTNLSLHKGGNNNLHHHQTNCRHHIATSFCIPILIQSHP